MTQLHQDPLRRVFFDYPGCLGESCMTAAIAAEKWGGYCYALDNLHGLDSALAAGYGYFIYHGRPDSYSTRNSHYSGAFTNHPGS